MPSLTPRQALLSAINTLPSEDGEWAIPEPILKAAGLQADVPRAKKYLLQFSRWARSMAAEALRNLTYNNAANQVAIIAAGGVEALDVRRDCVHRGWQAGSEQAGVKLRRPSDIGTRVLEYPNEYPLTQRERAADGGGGISAPPPLGAGRPPLCTGRSRGP